MTDSRGRKIFRLPQGRAVSPKMRLYFAIREHQAHNKI